MSRICTSCGEEKPLACFPRGKRYKGGYRPRCKTCEAEDPQVKYARNLVARQRNREYVWNYYLTHPCVDCGEDDPFVLEFDHVRGEKSSDISRMVNNTRSLASIQAEIEKCDVVCANCHKRRTAKTQDWYASVLVA